MKRHILTVHPTIYKCDYCDYESAKKEELYAHQVGLAEWLVLSFDWNFYYLQYNDHGLHLADINSEEMKVVIINDAEEEIV